MRRVNTSPWTAGQMSHICSSQFILMTFLSIVLNYYYHSKVWIILGFGQNQIKEVDAARKCFTKTQLHRIWASVQQPCWTSGVDCIKRVCKSHWKKMNSFVIKKLPYKETFTLITLTPARSHYKVLRTNWTPLCSLSYFPSCSASLPTMQCDSTPHNLLH